VNDDTFVPRGSAPPDTTVLGIVVEIPQPWSQLLTDWRAKVGDNQAGVVPPHVTLLPPTEVPTTHRPAVAAHLAGVARCHPPFTMHLSGTGTFRPVSDVVFVAVARGIGDCELLAGQVRRGPLSRSLSYPYHPHVTVAHDVPGDMLELAYTGLADLNAEFQVEHITEFEQTPDGTWAVAREYPLTGPARGD
jgi:2'-5' RNA ligase